VGLFRHEVEFKPKTNELPTDLIDRRISILLAHIHIWSEVLQNIEPEILTLSIEKKLKIWLHLSIKYVECMEQLCLTALVLLMAAMWGQFGKKLLVKEHNQPLVDAGVLMFDHDSF
jgi:hypothetical protein